ncbi:hypothetical protein GF402_06330 [Candidatus Fermentibacteria bacterium]|nr:hypothetical protein [Candidatus Fermentibacteria bacterium]
MAENNSIWDKLFNMDRRWIFLLMAVVVIIPFFFKMGLPINTTDEVEGIYNYVDSLEQNDAVMIGFDYQPGTMAENQPMSEAVMRHCFARKVPVFITAVLPLGNGLAEEAIANLTDPDEPGTFQRVRYREWHSYDYGQDSLPSRVTHDQLVNLWERDHQLREDAMGWVFEGVDYVILGYAPLFHIVLLGMGRSIVSQYPADLYGNPTENMPMVKRNKSAREVDLGVTVAGSSAVLWWLTYAHESYGMPIAFGVTAVMATDYLVYLQSGQIVGQMGGLRGAAEYEVMLKRDGYSIEEGKAFRGMDVQSIAHILIVILIVVGNVAYFAGGYHRKGRRLRAGR